MSKPLLAVLVGLVVLSLTLISAAIFYYLWDNYLGSEQVANLQAGQGDGCHYSMNAKVMIGSHVFVVPAASGAKFWIESEEESAAIVAVQVQKGSTSPVGTYVFCLEGPQTTAYPVTSFELGAGNAFEAYARENGFSDAQSHLDVRPFSTLSWLPGVPDPVDIADIADEMFVYNRYPDSRSVSVVMRGFSTDGFRSKAECFYRPKGSGISQQAEHWGCRYLIADRQASLTYRYFETHLEAYRLDLDWVSQQSAMIVDRVRLLLQEMQVSGPELLAPETQQDL